MSSMTCLTRVYDQLYGSSACGSIPPTGEPLRGHLGQSGTQSEKARASNGLRTSFLDKSVRSRSVPYPHRLLVVNRTNDERRAFIDVVSDLQTMKPPLVQCRLPNGKKLDSSPLSSLLTTCYTSLGRTDKRPD